MGWPRWKVAVECDEEADAPDYREWVHSHTAELESRGWSVMWVTNATAKGQGSPGIVVLRAPEELLAAQRRRAS